MTYPLAEPECDGWYSDQDYVVRGGVMTEMTPQAFLSEVRPLLIDDVSRDNIDDLKEHILARRRLDPLRIRADGSEDGRHRAHACVELGIAVVPVLRMP